MKRAGRLFEQVTDPENLRLAFVKASRGKRHCPDQRMFQDSLDEELTRLRDGLIDGTYPIGLYRRFMIHDPKEREICAASFGERVLHHALMNVCEPHFDRWLIDNSFACRKGKGQLAAISKAQEYARRYAWYMKCDFRKYFDSVSHDVMLRLLARKFKDPSVLAWFGRILESYEHTPGHGLPIGNLTSQHFANLYLDPLDRLDCRPSGGYVRYMDDFIFWTNDKESLKRFRLDLDRFAREKLLLAFKQEPFINRTKQGMDFLGRRIYPHGVRLTRVAKRRYLDKVRECEWAYATGRISEQECQRRETALTAFAEGAPSRSWRQKHLAFCKERRATTASNAAAAGTTRPATAAPRTATTTALATPTTTLASAFAAPQHRRISILQVPAERQFPIIGTNNQRRSASVGDPSRASESPETPPFGEKTECK